MGNAYSDKKVCKCLEEPDLLQPKAQLVPAQGRDGRVNKTYALRSNSTVKASDFIKSGSGDVSHSKDSSVSQKGLGGRVRSHSQCIEIEANVDILRVKCGSSNGADAIICQTGRKASSAAATRQRVFSESSNETSTSVGSTRYSTREDQYFKELLSDLDRLSLENHSMTMESNEISDLKKKEKPGSEEDEDCIPKHVLYYGWFFSPETSSIINAVVMHFFLQCFNQVSQFQRFILSCCKDADIRDPFEYYKRPGKRVKPDDEIKYHITVKFMGRSPDSEYQPLVQPFLQKTFRVHLVGIVFTPKTLGVRVRLTRAQKLMFDEKDEYRTGKKLSLSKEDNNAIQSQILYELGSYKQSKRKGNPHCKLKYHDRNLSDKMVFKPLNIPSSSDPPVSTSRAHITIGCAPNVKPKQTGDDLVDIVDLEQRPVAASTNFQQDFKIEHGILRQFGRHGNAFVVYPDLEMIVPGEFNAFI
ncbi:2',3'-cyclic-nucleotide 3'-phosphodiesterase [Orchesella cincta]|uniref:2',3'-cyclic-nucleotide 3'-phosphodiesterase n=1 Tax=Orchesella cincta TaxID=48709 RepID=A0A1D2NG90_ORCCI|nr:2',3'-cyclic-nucleotide 3'-phosphodiesterase [Orchesella cincta]